MKGQKVLSVVSIVGLLLALAAGMAGQPTSAQAARPAHPLANAPAAGTAAITPGISPDWWATVQETIRTSEYYVTWQEQTYLADLPAAYQAPNRAHNLRTYFSPDGPIVIPRTWTEETNIPPWRLEMALAELGAGRGARRSIAGYAGSHGEPDRVPARRGGRVVPQRRERTETGI